MNAGFRRLGTTLLLAATLIACSKKQAEQEAQSDAAAPVATAEGSVPAPAPGRDALPGASGVRSALSSKDYAGAVNNLLALKGAATGPLAEEYMSLYNEVKLALMDASATDKNAAAALMSLRAASAGR